MKLRDIHTIHLQLALLYYLCSARFKLSCASAVVYNGVSEWSAVRIDVVESLAGAAGALVYTVDKVAD